MGKIAIDFQHSAPYIREDENSVVIVCVSVTNEFDHFAFFQITKIRQYQVLLVRPQIDVIELPCAVKDVVTQYFRHR